MLLDLFYANIFLKIDGWKCYWWKWYDEDGSDGDSSDGANDLVYFIKKSYQLCTL